MLDLVANSVLEFVKIPPVAVGNWADRIGELNRRMRKVLLGYPGLGSYLLQRPLTTAGRRLSESTHSIMRDAGLSERQAQLAAALPQAFLLGRLTIEAAVAAQRPEAPLTADRGCPHLSAEEVFEDGLGKIVAALRTIVTD